jgi:two-component system NtrC family sensor kinase
MSNTSATILVVDDAANNRQFIVGQLKNEGYAIITAASGEEALALIDRQLPDLILLDAMMPGISGFDVIDTLKSEARTATIPIIMLTALGDGASRLAALANGAEEFLTKPVARAELVMRIRNLLKLKKYQDGLSSYSNVLEERVADRTSELASANLQLSEAQAQLLQSEKLAALGQLAAGVAHEINNPIAFVSSNLGTLKGYIKDMVKLLDAYETANQSIARHPQLQARLDQLKAELELDFVCTDAAQLIDESLEGISRVCSIVQDLKSFAHVDAHPEWGPADVHECLDSTLNIASNEIRYKATVVKEYAVLPEIDCLPSQLNQVFLNLLVNAAQAISGPNQGTITVRTARHGEEILIEIHDTGDGIPPDNLKQIFDPFFTTKPVGSGTGLGLSISYGIIKRHHGRIDVRSEVGRGTSFCLTLPIHQPAGR